jgi:hypothetical protein
MARTPKNILDGLTKTIRDNTALRAAHPIGGKPKPGPISIGGGPKIVLKGDKPKEGPPPPAGGGSPSK